MTTLKRIACGMALLAVLAFTAGLTTPASADPSNPATVHKNVPGKLPPMDPKIDNIPAAAVDDVVHVSVTFIGKTDDGLDAYAATTTHGATLVIIGRDEQAADGTMHWTRKYTGFVTGVQLPAVTARADSAQGNTDSGNARLDL